MARMKNINVINNARGASYADLAEL